MAQLPTLPLTPGGHEQVSQPFVPQFPICNAEGLTLAALQPLEPFLV